MNPEVKRRTKLLIDNLLEELIGADVRVAARSFSPGIETGVYSLRLLPVSGLFLPDNSQAGGWPVYFEGKLLKFVRQIGVVFVWLDRLESGETAEDGLKYFRGRIAAILRGPAVVELAWPFQVERLPSDPDNYWRDIRFPSAQFEFAFPTETNTTNLVSTGLSPEALATLKPP